MKSNEDKNSEEKVIGRVKRSELSEEDQLDLGALVDGELELSQAERLRNRVSDSLLQRETAAHRFVGDGLRALVRRERADANGQLRSISVWQAIEGQVSASAQVAAEVALKETEGEGVLHSNFAGPNFTALIRNFASRVLHPPVLAPAMMLLLVAIFFNLSSRNLLGTLSGNQTPESLQERASGKIFQYHGENRAVELVSTQSFSESALLGLEGSSTESDDVSQELDGSATSGEVMSGEDGAVPGRIGDYMVVALDGEGRVVSGRSGEATPLIDLYKQIDELPFASGRLLPNGRYARSEDRYARNVAQQSLAKSRTAGLALGRAGEEDPRMASGLQIGGAEIEWISADGEVQVVPALSGRKPPVIWVGQGK